MSVPFRSTLLSAGMPCGLFGTAQHDASTVHVIRMGYDAVAAMERSRTLPIFEVMMIGGDGAHAIHQGTLPGDLEPGRNVLQLKCSK